jgi:hypothetical protein
MQLFKLKNIYKPKAAKGLFGFDNKVAAKAARDILNEGLDTDPEHKAHWKEDKGWRITYGPDHWRF